MDLTEVPEKSGLYCLKIRGGLTKFGVARNLRKRLASREYRTSIIDDYRVWLAPEEEIFDREAEIRKVFQTYLRPGFRDYLLGDKFSDVSGFMDKLLGQGKGKDDTELFGLPLIKKVLGIGTHTT